VPGCTLFVKLWQFDPSDRNQLGINTAAIAYKSAPDRPGVELLQLFEDDHENVRLERWQPGAAIRLSLPGGAELLVLDGTFEEAGERFEKQSWLRLPVSSTLRVKVGADECTVWIKTGHLLHIQGVLRS
jgi:hypothetical protein